MFFSLFGAGVVEGEFKPLLLWNKLRKGGISPHSLARNRSTAMYVRSVGSTPGYQFLGGNSLLLYRGASSKPQLVVGREPRSSLKGQLTS